MNEYNERLLKNVLQDYSEENDEQLSKEIEEAKNNPLFQNKEGEAVAFAEKYCKKQKKNWTKPLIKVASILLVVAIGVSFIPFTVEGRKSSVAEIIANFINADFIAFDSNDDDNLLLAYEGEFIPTFIPKGYSVESINNGKSIKEIVFTNFENIILYSEQIIDVKTNVDYSDKKNLQEFEALGYKGVYFVTNDACHVVIITDNSIITIMCDDLTFDLIGFAEKIEKR